MKSTNRYKLAACVIVALFTVLVIALRMASKGSSTEYGRGPNAARGSGQNGSPLREFAAGSDVEEAVAQTGARAAVSGRDSLDVAGKPLPLPDELDFQGFGLIPSEVGAWKSLPAAISPDETSLDPNTVAFFNRHNALRADLAKVTMDGESVWPGFADDRAWPLHLELDCQKNTALVESGNQRAMVKGKGVYAFSDATRFSMHTNLAHLLMFRRYDPREFKAVREQKLVRQGRDGAARSIDVKVVASRKGEVLHFEKETGRLVRVEMPVMHDVLQLDMDDFAVIDESRHIVLPTLVTVRVPQVLFSVPLPPRFERVIQLRVDPEQVKCLVQADLSS